MDLNIWPHCFNQVVFWAEVVNTHVVSVQEARKSKHIQAFNIKTRGVLGFWGTSRGRIRSEHWKINNTILLEVAFLFALVLHCVSCEIVVSWHYLISNELYYWDRKRVHNGPNKLRHTTIFFTTFSQRMCGTKCKRLMTKLTFSPHKASPQLTQSFNFTSISSLCLSPPDTLLPYFHSTFYIITPSWVSSTTSFGYF